MKIKQVYSHMNGLEFLLVHKSELWKEIQTVIFNVNAQNALIKQSREKTRKGQFLYSPKELNKFFKLEFEKRGWHESKIYYYVNEDVQTARETVNIINRKEQKQAIIDRGFNPLNSNNQVDFVKDKAAVEVQFGKYSFVQYDLHVKHTFFYQRGDIDVGIEIIPMQSMRLKMSSGIAWYENELTNIVREGRSNPAVPIVLIGVEPD